MNAKTIQEIINIFANLQNVSMSKKSHFLMRDILNFRKRNLPDEEMKMDDERQNIIDDLSKKIPSLRKRLMDIMKEKLNYLTIREC